MANNVQGLPPAVEINELWNLIQQGWGKANVVGSATASVLNIKDLHLSSVDLWQRENAIFLYLFQTNHANHLSMKS
jgi:hypothetical protein